MEAPSEQTAARPAKPRRASSSRRRGGNTPSLSVAVRAVEKRLVAAIKERDKAAREWAILNAKLAQAAGEYTARNTEVNSLQNTLVVLRGNQTPNGYLPVRAQAMPYPSPRNVPMETIMSDVAIPPAALPAQTALVPAAAQAGPPISVQLPVPEPSYIPGRAGGGAMETSLAADDQDEDQHLKSSAVAGGAWV